MLICGDNSGEKVTLPKKMITDLIEAAHVLTSLAAQDDTRYQAWMFEIDQVDALCDTIDTLYLR